MKRLIVLLALSVSLPALAAEEEEGPWSGKATLGFLATSGNTENSTLNSGLEIGYRAGSWLHEAKTRAVHATENDETTAEAYEFGWKSEVDLGPNQFGFGRVDWRKDLFSGYDTQFSQSVGYGRRLIDGEKHKLNVEGGIGARQSDLDDGTEEEEFIIRVGADYEWVLSESAKFTQDFSAESGDANTYIETVTAVSATLVGDLALVFSFTVKNNSDVPVGREKTDTFTAISLEYQF